MINFGNKIPKILVIGDLIIDHYLWGTCDRISPEAPVQVIKVDNESSVLGGAGNVINNLVALGAKADIISVIGECKASQEVKDLLKNINVDTQYLLIQKDRIVSKKSRIISARQQVIRFDREDTNQVNFESQNTIINYVKKIVNNYDVILLSDYGKGLFTFNLTQSLIEIANNNYKKLLIDPKGNDYSKYNGAYLLTPNRKEAGEATNSILTNNNNVLEAIKNIKKQCSLQVSLITLSDQGVAVYDDEFRIHPTVAIEVFDVTGAGDTMLASLGYALACKCNIDDSVKFANLASGVVVGKIGSATATLNEIIEHESSLNKSNSSISSDHIKNWDEISSIVSGLKNRNRKIIFTNGCFDILHLGHIKYLEEAKSFGDVLIVGLNSDSSIRKIKGNGRPINNQDERAYILASLQMVDYLVIFDEDTPYELIKLITPDILVKGGDYEGKEVVGQDIAKDLKIVKLIKGRSTSNTIKMMKIK